MFGTPHNWKVPMLSFDVENQPCWQQHECQKGMLIATQTCTRLLMMQPMMAVTLINEQLCHFLPSLAVSIYRTGKSYCCFFSAKCFDFLIFFFSFFTLNFLKLWQAIDFACGKKNCRRHGFRVDVLLTS
jgi:hypothetical protein